MAKIFVTGAAGFIGSHLSRRLLDAGNLMVGLDNPNDYCDVSLKEALQRTIDSKTAAGPHLVATPAVEYTRASR